MKYNKFLLLYTLLLPSTISASPFVDIQTNIGTITIELNTQKAPLTVNNFLSYVDTQFYDNTIFHRVIDGFVIQGGGLTPDFTLKETLDPITLESNQGLDNNRGTIAMARLDSPINSATAQFFINTVDNGSLNYKNTNSPGYAVFGTVIEGIETVDSISKVETNRNAIPNEPVIIESIRRRDGQLAFRGAIATYSTGNTINITLEEFGIDRQKTVDLWIAILLPNGEFLYLNQAAESLFTSTPTAFKQAVDPNETAFPVLNYTVPTGITGHYTFFAIFNESNADINNLTSSLRSNIASVSIDIVN